MRPSPDTPDNSTPSLRSCLGTIDPGQKCARISRIFHWALSSSNMGVSSHRSVDRVDHEPDGDSTLSPSERQSIHGSEKQEEKLEPEPDQEKEKRGHYRSLTFEDILPPHLIATAPSLDDERKRGMFCRSGKSSTPLTTTIPEPRSRTKRGYPLVKHSGTKSRFKATVRALVRPLSISKGGSGCGRSSDYEAMK